MALIQLILFLFPSMLLYLFWRFALRRGWRSMRLLALTFGLAVFLSLSVFWLGIRETWIVGFAVAAGVLATISVLLWPVTFPQFRRAMEQLGFKW